MKTILLRIPAIALLGLAFFSPASAQTEPVLKRFFRTSPAPAVDSGFGSSIATNGPLVVSGKPDAEVIINSVPFTERGLVFIFDSKTGALKRTLEPPQADRAIAFLQFGKSVALFGNTLAIGAPRSPSAAIFATGSVYLYNAATGAFLLKIPGADDAFGTSVALHEDLLVVGSPKEDSGRGASYVYSVSSGSQLARLTASDRAVNDAFGTAVAVSQYYIVVGSPLDDTTRGVNAGSGYLFDAMPNFKQLRKLTDESVVLDNQTNANSLLGSSVALRGQQIFIGAPDGDVNGNIDAGFVVLFVANQPSDIGQLILPDIFNDSGFGSSLATSDDLLAVGTRNGSLSFPKVAVFSLDNWESPQFAAALRPPGFLPGITRESTAAVHGNTVVGISKNNPSVPESGSIYQLSPVLRPPMSGNVAFPRGAFAPGVPAATIANSLVQLQDTSAGRTHELLALTGIGSVNGKNRGIWTSSSPTVPAFLQTQSIGGGEILTRITSLRAGGGRSQIQGKRKGPGISSGSDDLILAQGDSQTPLIAFAEGGFPSGGGGPNPPQFASFRAHALTDTGVSITMATLKRSAASGVRATNDSLVAINNTGAVTPQPLPPREGDTFAGMPLGQILPRLAAGGNALCFTAAITGSSTQNQGVFHVTAAGIGNLVARKGNNANVGGLGTEIFLSFLGESMNASGGIGLRARLTGGNVTARTNEALFTAGVGFSPVLLIRKGDQAPGLPAGVRIAAFLSFQRTSKGGAMLYLARLAGPGVNAANDLAIFTATPFVALPPGSNVIPNHLLLREGDPLPSTNKAIIRTLHRVAYGEDGNYMALVSLTTRFGEATSADNLALLYAESNFTQPSATDAQGFRKPFILLRKGTAFIQAGGQAVKSLSFFPGTITPGGASGTGMGAVATGSIPEWIIDFGRGQRGSFHGGFNN